jgi:hypothetical protein
MGLIREINTALEDHIKAEEEFFGALYEKIETVLEKEYHSELFESAEQFLNQMADIIKTGKDLDPDQAGAMGAKLAALQLLANPGTRSSALSVIAGADAAKKLSIIMKQASGSDQPVGQVDKVLIALANKVGKSGVTQNTQMLTGLGNMDEKARATKANQLIGLANTFKQLDAQIQQAPAQPSRAPTGNTPPAAQAGV